MINTDITPQRVIHTASGETTLAQITSATKRWYAATDFNPDIPVLWDLRDAALSITEENLDEWSSENSALINELRAGRKTAWVFGNPEAAEFASNLLGSYDWQHKVRIFNNDMEAATAWLHSTIR